jgi:hypothetical protein
MFYPGRNGTQPNLRRPFGCKISHRLLHLSRCQVSHPALSRFSLPSFHVLTMASDLSLKFSSSSRTNRTQGCSGHRQRSGLPLHLLHASMDYILLASTSLHQIKQRSWFSGKIQASHLRWSVPSTGACLGPGFDSRRAHMKWVVAIFCLRLSASLLVEF